MNFTNNLKSYIRSKKISQKELAETLGVPTSTVHGWINGVIPKDINTLRKISTLMNISLDELCFEHAPSQLTKDSVWESDIVVTLGKSSFKIILQKVN